MHRGKRTKRADDAPVPPPPSPPPRYDSSDESSHDSGHHTDSALPYEQSHFSMPTRRMYRAFRNLKTRSCENTRLVDMDTLREMGVETEFLHLTGRIGISADFWTIEGNTYPDLTWEFLSSLQFKWDDDEHAYVKFRMCGQTHRVLVSDLRGWFGFHPEPDQDEPSFRPDHTRDTMWTLITGQPVPARRDFRSRQIPHPALRVIHRAIASTIFARGETVARVSTEELILLDYMLLPEDELRRPDLMRLMIDHWLGQQGQTRGGGVITCGAYITHIAERLHLQIPYQRIGSGPTSLSLESFQLAHFIQVRRGGPGHRRITWLLADGTSRILPLHCPIDFTDPATWRLEAQVDQPPPAQADPVEEGTPEGAPQPQQHPVYPADPTLREIHTMVQSGFQQMHHHFDQVYAHFGTLNDRFDDYGARIAALEDMMRRWGGPTYRQDPGAGGSGGH